MVSGSDLAGMSRAYLVGLIGLAIMKKSWVVLVLGVPRDVGFEERRNTFKEMMRSGSRISALAGKGQHPGVVTSSGSVLHVVACLPRLPPTNSTNITNRQH